MYRIFQPKGQTQIVRREDAADFRARRQVFRQRKQLAATQPASLLRRQGMEATGRLADDLGQRAAHVRRRTETIEHCVDGLIADLARLFGRPVPSDRLPPAAH